MSFSTPDSLRIRVALVEPNDADVCWFNLIVKEAKWPVETTHYKTALSALNEWSVSEHSSFDVIVVADLLPILTVEEFISQARVSQPEAKIVVATEPISVRWLQKHSYACYPKPLSVADIRELIGQYRKSSRLEQTSHTPVIVPT